MESFKTYLSESVSGKNTHMTHIEDRVIYGGVKGAREAIFALRAMRDMLAGNSNKNYDVTVKWDGAPAVFAGIDPSDGEFFVAKKGIFNKDPKVYKSEADVRADTSGDLADKLIIAYNELKDLGIKDVIQGDIMFTKGDISKETIDGEGYFTFQPNTIVYAVPIKSDLGKQIAKANLGVVWHTTYKGETLEGMTASFGMDQPLKQVPSVWHTNAQYKDLSGTVKFTGAETAAVTKHLSEAGKVFRQINSKKIRDFASLQETLPASAQWKTYDNSLIRQGKTVTNPRMHIAEYFKFVHDAFVKITATKKTEKSQKQWNQRKEAFFKELRKHTSNMVAVSTFMMHIVDAKMKIVKK